MPIANSHGFIHAKHSLRRSQCQTNSVSYRDINPSEISSLAYRRVHYMNTLLASTYIAGFLSGDGNIFVVADIRATGLRGNTKP